MKIVCLVNCNDGAVPPLYAELELTRQVARRLMAYHPLVESCQAVDPEFYGIEFDHTALVKWGKVLGLYPSRDEWYVAPHAYAFTPLGYASDDPSLVVTEAGVYVESVTSFDNEFYDATTVRLGTPVLGWDVIAEVAEGKVADLPDAPTEADDIEE